MPAKAFGRRRRRRQANKAPVVCVLSSELSTSVHLTRQPVLAKTLEPFKRKGRGGEAGKQGEAGDQGETWGRPPRSPRAGFHVEEEEVRLHRKKEKTKNKKTQLRSLS